MCQFKSAIVIQDEREREGYRLVMSPYTESHSELCLLHKLRDGARLNMAKIEFTPKEMSEADKPDTYSLRIDEERTPEWFTDALRDSVTERMRNYIRSIIVSGNAEILLGGQYILSAGAYIGSANHVMIAAMCGGTLNYMYGGTLNDMWGGTLNAMRGGTLNDITDYYGPTIKAKNGGTIVKDNRATASEAKPESTNNKASKTNTTKRTAK